MHVSGIRWCADKPPQAKPPHPSAALLAPVEALAREARRVGRVAADLLARAAAGLGSWCHTAGDRRAVCIMVCPAQLHCMPWMGGAVGAGRGSNVMYRPRPRPRPRGCQCGKRVVGRRLNLGTVFTGELLGVPEHVSA